MARENVWDYPRPPRLEAVPATLRIDLGGRTIATTRAGWRVLETSHPPTYYLPPDAFRDCALEPSPRRSMCEWKGQARYWTIRAGDLAERDAAWSYAAPTPAFLPIKDHLAVYAHRMAACFVGAEPVIPQPGDFYGGWITADLIGPFKGAPGTSGW